MIKLKLFKKYIYNINVITSVLRKEKCPNDAVNERLIHDRMLTKFNYLE